MFIGAYWSERKEPREDAAKRIAEFLTSITSCSEHFSKWFGTARSKAAALQLPIAVDSLSVASKLSVNRRDIDRQSIPDLGYSLAVWNGGDVSFSARVGVYNPYASNVVTLELGDSVALSPDVLKKLLEEMIRAFDPDEGVVTDKKHMRQMGLSKPWEAGWFTYERGGEVKENSSFSDVLRSSSC